MGGCRVGCAFDGAPERAGGGAPGNSVPNVADGALADVVLHRQDPGDVDARYDGLVRGGALTPLLEDLFHCLRRELPAAIESVHWSEHGDACGACGVGGGLVLMMRVCTSVDNAFPRARTCDIMRFPEHGHTHTAFTQG